MRKFNVGRVRVLKNPPRLGHQDLAVAVAVLGEGHRAVFVSDAEGHESGSCTRPLFSST